MYRYAILYDYTDLSGSSGHPSMYGTVFLVFIFLLWLGIME